MKLISERITHGQDKTLCKSSYKTLKTMKNCEKLVMEEFILVYDILKPHSKERDIFFILSKETENST